MITSRSPKLLAIWVPAFALLALTASLQAQTSRNNTSSSNTRSSSSANRSTSNSGGNSSSNGVRQYRSNTLLGDALIQVDPESRSVVVVTDDDTHAAITKVISSLDHPKPQVLIKVVFVEVAFDKNLDVGIEGNYTFKVGNGTPTSAGSTVKTTTKNSTKNGATTQSVSTETTAINLPTEGKALAETLFGLADQSTGSFARITTDNWAATLHAMQTNGNLRVLSRPSIMARNNQEAVIVVGQEVPFITNSQITTDGQTINTIQYRDVGIILRVTPFITSDKSVEMIVSPEISSISNQTIPISSTVNAAVINKRSAETVVVTPNATTVVIGGLMQKQETSTVQKIPLLGDIPLLGQAFRHTVKGESKSELLIFLTPYIIESSQKLRDVTLNEANRAELTRDSLTPEDIRNNLDTLRLMPQNDSDSRPKVETKTKIETVIEPAKSTPAKR